MLYLASSLLAAVLALVLSYIAACSGGAGYCGVGAMLYAVIAAPCALIISLVCGLPVKKGLPLRGAIYSGISVMSAVTAVLVASTLVR